MRHFIRNGDITDLAIFLIGESLVAIALLFIGSGAA